MSKTPDPSVLRILDASANRAGEGLRTVEEWARFSLNDAELSAELKIIRHQVAAAVASVPRIELLAARDTPGDVGTDIGCPDEQTRENAADVVAAGIARTGQSLRVIEEYLKTIAPQAARTVEKARYQFYTASVKLELRLSRSDRSQRLHQSSVYGLIDAGEHANEFESRVAALCESGIDILQLRDRTQTDRTLIARAKVGTEIANRHGVLFVMNDRADLAVAAGCDGVHIGQDELPAQVARSIVGHDRIVGVSTHCIDQARQANRDGADYIGCGPVFPSQTKSFDQFAGLDYLRQVTQEVSIPWFAIGGIDTSNVDQVVDAGCHRIAVTAALQDCDNLVAIVGNLKKQLAVGQPIKAN
jgi:thiamine-phosphate pyrophosphorylase